MSLLNPFGLSFPRVVGVVLIAGLGVSHASAVACALRKGLLAVVAILVGGVIRFGVALLGIRAAPPVFLRDLPVSRLQASVVRAITARVPLTIDARIASASVGTGRHQRAGLHQRIRVGGVALLASSAFTVLGAEQTPSAASRPALSTPAIHSEERPMDKHSGERDFDFLIGHWNVRHRRLKERLRGSHSWDEFGGSMRAQPMLDGQANVDDNLLELPAGHYRAVSIRSFDPATGLWAIWWLDARSPHALEKPVLGQFVDGIGTFETVDELNGRPIRVRFTWSEIAADSARWQQSFSDDEGASWEVNWVMEFQRRPD